MIGGGLAGIAVVLVGNLALGMNFEVALIVRLVVIAAVAAGALGAAITLYTRPIGLHADPRAASILDLLSAGATGLVLAAVLDIIALATGNNRTLPLLILLPVAAAHMACIRVGTLGVFADFPKSARAKRMWARLLGGTAGLVMISLALWEPHLANDSLIGVAWALLATAGFGVASAYALIDGQSNLDASSTRAAMRPFGRFWQVAIVLVGVSAALAQLLPVHQPQTPPAALSIISGKPENAGETQRDISIKQLPTSLSLDVKSGGPASVPFASVPVDLFAKPVGPWQCQASAQDPNDQFHGAIPTFGGSQMVLLSDGAYRLRVDRRVVQLPGFGFQPYSASSQPEDLWPDLASHVARKTCVLTIKVNDPDHRLITGSAIAAGLR